VRQRCQFIVPSRRRPRRLHPVEEAAAAPEHVKEAAAALAPVEAVATAPVPGRGGGRGSGLQDQLLLPLLPPQRSN